MDTSDITPEDLAIRESLRRVRERVLMLTKIERGSVAYSPPIRFVSTQSIRRRDLIIGLREKGQTLEEIAKSLTPPITRERVRQIVTAVRPDLCKIKVVRKKKVYPLYKFTCKRCRVEFESRKVKKTWCSKKCWRATPEERIARERNSWVKLQQLHAHKMANDPEYRRRYNAKQNEFHKAWHKKNKDRILARHKERYANDPVYREKIKKRNRDRYVRSIIRGLNSQSSENERKLVLKDGKLKIE